MDMMEVADPDAVHAVRSFIKKKLASELKEELLNTVVPLLNFLPFVSRKLNIFLNKLSQVQVKSNRSSDPYEFNHVNMARRALKNIALGLF